MLAKEKPKPAEKLFSDKALLALFLPLLAEQSLVFLVGLVDSMMVASVGEAAISGVSLVEFIMALLISLFAALATGGAVIAGQYIGKSQQQDAQEAADQLVWFVTLVSLVIMVSIYVARPYILDTLFGDISEDVRKTANTYLSIIALSIPFIGLYSAGAAIFRTMGNSRLPMYIALLMGLLTVAGNALALYVFKVGIAGVAVSAVIARITGAFLIVKFARNTKQSLHIRSSFKHTFNWSMIKRIMGIGVPYGMENCLFHFGRIIVLSLVATFGTVAIVANAVAGTISLFGALPGMAIGLGQTVIIARCVGAGDYEQAKYYTKRIIAFIYITHGIGNVLLLLLLPFIIDIYGLSTEAAALTTKIVWWHAAFAVTIWPLAYSIPVTLRAAGDANYPMYVSIASMFACRIALAYLLSNYLGIGFLGTWLATFIDWIVKAILFVWRYYSGVWMRFRAI